MTRPRSFEVSEIETSVATAINEFMARENVLGLCRESDVTDIGAGGELWQRLTRAGFLPPTLDPELARTPVLVAYHCGRWAVPLDYATCYAAILPFAERHAAVRSLLEEGKALVTVRDQLRSEGTTVSSSQPIALAVSGDIDWYIVRAGSGRVVLVPADAPGVRRRSKPTTFGRWTEVELAGAPGDELPDDAEAVFRTSATLRNLSSSATLVGLARGALDLAIDYVRQRRQFGRLIGEFQAVQHQLADVALWIDAAELAMMEVAKAGSECAPEAQDMLRVLAEKASSMAARHCHQVLGGYGFTSEFDMHLYSRQITVLRAGNRLRSAAPDHGAAVPDGDGVPA